MKKSNKILLFGLLIGILYIVLCIYIQKDKISAKLSPVTAITTNNKVQEIALEPKVDTNNSTKNKPTLEYKIENGVITIAGNMPILDDNDKLKKTMMRFCGEEYCDRTILFSSDREKPLWKNIAQEFIDLFYDENLTNASFVADKFSNIFVDGELLTQRAKDKIVQIINSNKSIHIIDNTHLKVLTLAKEIPKISKAKIDVNKSLDKNITIVDTTLDVVEIAQNKISELLESQRINFVRNHARLTKKSIHTLKEIISILKDIPNIEIIVKGYTDAGGKRDINRWISEVRAKRVKEYLGSHGIDIHNIKSKGFGEDDLLDEKNPYNPLNRRVEIEIIRR